MFEPLLSLRKLDFTRNRISAISPTSFPPHFLKSVKILMLGHNPFHCDCGILWFKNLLNNSKIDFISNNFSKYICFSPTIEKGVLLEALPLTPEICDHVEVNMDFIVSVSICAAIAVSVVLFSLLYKYHWHLRYVYGVVGLWPR